MAGEKTKIVDLKKDYDSLLKTMQAKAPTADIDTLANEVKDRARELVNCERVTIYMKDPLKAEIVSKAKDSTEVKEIRLPIGPGSLAGFVASTQKTVRLINAYDVLEWAEVDPKLKFDKEWDKQTGFVTKQVLAVPILKDGRFLGVIQALNTKDGMPFADEHLKIINDFAGVLAIALAGRAKASVKASQYEPLLRAGTITQDTLDRAISTAQKENVSVEHVLMTKFEVPVDSIGAALKEYYRSEFVAYKPASILLPTELLQKFTVDYLKHHLVVPIGKEESGKVTVLMANPRSLTDQDDVQRRLGVARITVKVATREHVLEFIDEFFGLKKDAKEMKEVSLDKIVQNIEKREAEAAADPKGKNQEEEKNEDDASIIGIVNQIIEQAYVKGASDIHIEPVLEGSVIIRFRVDGSCFEHARVPGSYGRAIVSRIKIMSNLDIAERRLPQDGKIRFRDFGGRDIELRVATLPTTGGTEDIVMRILAASKPRKISDMGIATETLARLLKVIEEPYGIFLCVGPTGSGKTTTLHSCLGHLNQPDVKIWTAEDPVEITQAGLRQVQVQAKIGFTFERALRAFLRADPDIIMIGEMRDLETAGAAIEASLTGHMVFSTLHTNSAPETVTRLLDMGLDPFAFGDSLLAVLAQRLLRSLCKDCKEQYECTDEEFDTLRKEYNNDKGWDGLKIDQKQITMFRAKGCEKCNKTGYRGRVGIHELLATDDDVRLMVYRKAKSMEIRDDAIKKGMFTLKQDGIRKVMRGLTDLKEVRSVASK